MMTIRLLLLDLPALLLTAGVGLGAATPTGGAAGAHRSTPAGQDAGSPDASAPRGIEDAGEASDEAVHLLDALEASGRTLTAFTASVTYRTEDAFIGAQVTSKGRLLYHAEPGTSSKSFAIMFDTTIEDQRKSERREHFIFKDGWLVEIDHDDRQFIKRQIAEPGAGFDPLKLGEGPFPLPIDQRRVDVLERFDVTLIDLPEDGLLAKLRGGRAVDGLRLVPRVTPARASDEVKRIDLFYDRVTRLPAGIDLIEHNDNRKTVRLDDLERNPTLTAEQLRQIDITEPDPRQWRIDRRPLE